MKKFPAGSKLESTDKLLAPSTVTMATVCAQQLLHIEFCVPADTNNCTN